MAQQEHQAISLQQATEMSNPNVNTSSNSHTYTHIHTQINRHEISRQFAENFCARSLLLALLVIWSEMRLLCDFSVHS